jgi:hypothetical protein
LGVHARSLIVGFIFLVWGRSRRRTTDDND